MKKYVIVIIISILLLALIPLLSASCFFYMMRLAMEIDIVEKTVTTPYGDCFYIKSETYHSLSQPSRVQLRVLYNDEEILSPSHIGYDDDGIEKVVDMSAKGQARVYRFNWGIIYTTDGGDSFQCEIRNRYPDRYRTDEEFVQIYGMLFETPFYDERLAEHLDINRLKLPNGEAAERVAEYAKSERKNRYISISEIEAQVGKAQMCIGVTTSDEENGEKVLAAILEYEVSDGRILHVSYVNRSEGSELDLYASDAYIRESYYSEESETDENTPMTQTSVSADYCMNKNICRLARWD